MKALPKPPEDLLLIIDAAIDHVLRGTPLPNIQPLCDWADIQGLDVLNIVDNGFDFSTISGDFNDDFLSSEEDLDKEKITEDERVNFANKIISNYAEDSINLLTVMVLPIKNSNNEIAILGQIQYQENMCGRASWWGVYKNLETFSEDLEKSGWFMSIGDINTLTKNEILKYWQ